MTDVPDVSGDRIAGRERAPAESALLDVNAIAKLLACSPKHAHRLARTPAASLKVAYDHKKKTLQLTVRGIWAIIVVGIILLGYVALRHGG